MDDDPMAVRMLRSAMLVAVIALGCIGYAQSADALSPGFNRSFNHGGRFDGRHGFDHRGFGSDRFFFGFNFGFGGNPVTAELSPALTERGFGRRSYG